MSHPRYKTSDCVHRTGMPPEVLAVIDARVEAHRLRVEAEEKRLAEGQAALQVGRALCKTCGLRYAENDNCRCLRCRRENPTGRMRR